MENSSTEGGRFGAGAGGGAGSDIGIVSLIGGGINRAGIFGCRSSANLSEETRISFSNSKPSRAAFSRAAPCEGGPPRRSFTVSKGIVPPEKLAARPSGLDDWVYSKNQNVLGMFTE